MDDQVFRAILALDSYNRGYEPGILGLSDDQGTLVGTAEIVLSDGLQDAQGVGFYAIAYEWNGETVISYRGTDDVFGGNDIWPPFSGRNAHLEPMIAVE